MKTKIIDFEIKGSMVKFYVGKEDLLEWWGDDWNDAPYEHNAGQYGVRRICRLEECRVLFEYPRRLEEIIGVRILVIG